MTIHFRRDTAAGWTAANPVLEAGRPGYETDTGRIKIGDGVTAWTSLAYRFESGGGGGSATPTFETVSKNLDASDAVLNYSGGELSQIVYANGVIKTFAYGPDGLASVTLSGSTPGGIDLTKTFTYSGGDLTAVSYS
jgi:hypothetical protein